MNAARALALACVLALLGAGRADAHTSSDFAGHHRQVFRVVVVRGLVVADLPLLASQGAVGLVVPNAGPRTSANDAFVGMVRGILYNARLPQPHGELVLIHVRSATSIPRKGPVIVIGLPPNRSVANDRRYPIAVIGHRFRPGSDCPAGTAGSLQIAPLNGVCVETLADTTPGNRKRSSASCCDTAA